MAFFSLPGISPALAAAVCLIAPLSAQSNGGVDLPEGLSPADWADIQSVFEARVYRAESVPEGFRAFNQSQGWWTEFDGQGFLVQPRDGEWTWGLELESYGFVGHTQYVGEEAEAGADGNRVTYGWDANLEEWYINDTRGLEHGFTLVNRPEGAAGSLTFELAIRGSLLPKVQESGTGLTFWDSEGIESLSYSGLHVFDANGVTQQARFTVSEDSIQIVVDEAHATYPLTVDPVSQRDYLKAFNTDAGDHFGASIAMADDRVAVGAPDEDSNAQGVNLNGGDNSAQDAGAVYVFQYVVDRWRIIAYLKASNTDAGDRFGASVAMQRDRIVVGAPGEDSNAISVNGNGTNNSDLESGAAYIFDYASSQGAWVQTAYLKANNTDPGDAFGFSVSVEGDLVAVGAPAEDGSSSGVNGVGGSNGAPDSGAAYLYATQGQAWTFSDYFKASNNGGGDMFGSAVAVAMPNLFVGSPHEDSNAVGLNGNQSNNSAVWSGAAYSYISAGGAWVFSDYLKASNTDSGDLFGSSIAAIPANVVIGAPGESSDAIGTGGDETNYLSFRSGAAYVFSPSALGFLQEAYLKASDVNSNGGFGTQVAISGDRILVGAPRESQGSGSSFDNFHTGAGYLFAWAGGAWTQGPYLKASNPDRLDKFGGAVAISGDRVVLGAWGEDGSSRGPFGDDTDNLASESGAGFIFDLANPIEAYCQPSVMNSTDFGGVLLASGSVRTGDNRFYLGAAQIPFGSYGYFLASLSRDFVPMAMGSQGTMCVGGFQPVARKAITLRQAPDFGFVSSAIDLTAIPLPGGPVAVAPGETWHFQCWYRDMNPGPTSNFTSALSVSFE
ncbi:MAG: hypothetical protein ACI87O_000876 [Planctomycetota bacterium]|jgi:hypothetical protein